MKTIPVEELLEIFDAEEGSINLYYGLIGHGKTYAATADILELLKQGKVVYCNWHINVDDFDDRTSLFMNLKNLITFNSIYFRIPCKQNLHYFDPLAYENNQELILWLSKLNDCHIFFDEGQDIFDSYEGTRTSKEKRRLVLHTRQYHRTLNIITQRPTAIQVSARGNISRFYKCEKIASWPWVQFIRTEYQAMKNETVDEESEPVSVKKYYASQKVFSAYNTNYLSQGIPKSQNVFFEAYEVTFLEKLRFLFSSIVNILFSRRSE